MTINTIIVVGLESREREREASVLTIWSSNPGRGKICFLLLNVLIVCESHSACYSMGNAVLSWG